MQGLTRRWVISSRAPDGAFDLVQRVLAARGLTDADEAAAFLDPTRADLHDAGELPGVHGACARILKAVADGERIAIYGDYDVDGVTATATLVHVLRAIEPSVDVEPYIPHRLEEGYGLNAKALTELAERGTTLVITVDCGVTAVEEARHCAQLGMDLVITDHHLVHADTQLPEAFATVHPGLLQSGYPWPDLSGSAVAWKLARVLGSTFQGKSDPDGAVGRALRDTLCLAGMGVIADVMPLVGENRRIVAKALRLMRSCSLPGVQAMLKSCLKPGEALESETVAFRIGPRLNAAGRLGHAQEALDVLTTTDPAQAEALAGTLKHLNEQRQELVRGIEVEAMARVQAEGMDRDDRRAIVLDGDGWHPGVIGIVCSRLVERFHRPTILLCGHEGSEELKGSARSIPGFSIYDALNVCAAHLDKWGGHHMAAGVQLRRENLQPFVEAMLAHASRELSPEDLVGEVRIDAEVARGELSPGAVRGLDRLRPFGRGNPTPRLLLRNQPIERVRTMGRHSNHLELVLGELRAVWWGEGRFESRLPRGVRVDVVGRAEVDSWNDRERVQVIVDDVRPC